MKKYKRLYTIKAIKNAGQQNLLFPVQKSNIATPNWITGGFIDPHYYHTGVNKAFYRPIELVLEN